MGDADAEHDAEGPAHRKLSSRFRAVTDEYKALQAELEREEAEATGALVAKLRERATVLAKQRHIDVLYFGEALLYAGERGDLTPSLLDPKARFVAAEHLASADLRRALTSCQDGQREQAQLNQAKQDAERELNRALRAGHGANGERTQRGLNDRERSATERIAAALREDAAVLARTRGLDLVQDASLEDGSDVIYRAPGAGARLEDLTAPLVKLHDQRSP